MLRIPYLYLHGGDAWVSFINIQQMLFHGYIPWYLSPLSYYGYYFESDSSGFLVLTLVLSLLCNLPIEQLFTIESIYFSIIGLLGMFVLVQKFGKDDRLTLLSLLLFTTMNSYLVLTWRAGSSRGPLISCYPVLIFFLISAYQNNGLKRINFSCLFLFSALLFASIHLMFHYFVILIFLPFIAVLILSWIIRKIPYNIADNRNNFNKIYLGMCMAIFCSHLLGFSPRNFGDSDMILGSEGSYVSNLFENTNPLFMVINISYNYLFYYNITFFMLIFGVMRISALKHQNIFNKHLLIIFPLSLLFITESQYFPPFFSPLASIFIAHAFLFSIEKRNLFGKNISIILILLVCFGTASISWKYLSSSSFGPLSLSLFSIVILFYGVYQVVYNASKKSYIQTVLVSFLILSLSFSVNSTISRSEEHIDEFSEGRGKIHSQYEAEDKGLWVRENNDGKTFLTDNTQYPVLAFSGAVPAVHLSSLSGNFLIIEHIDPEFDLSELIRTGKLFLHISSPPHRYDLTTAYSLILAGDTELAEKYKVELFITPSEKELQKSIEWTLETKNFERDLSIHAILSEDRFLLYRGATSNIYFFNA